MASVGPNSPSAASGWTTSSNVYSSNNLYASNSILAGSTGSELKVQGFGFAIAAGATIDGITVSIERKEGGAGVYDNDLNVLDASSSAVGTNKADTITEWPLSDGVATYGGSADTWSAGLTVTDVNSSNFGIRLIAQNKSGSARVAYVDYVSITINYTDAGQPMQARSRRVPFMRKARQIGW